MSSMVKVVVTSYSGKKSKVGQILEATLDGNLEQIKKLGNELDNGKGIAETISNVRDTHGRGLLQYAALKGRTNVCKYLLEELNFDVDEKDSGDWTALQNASLNGHLSTVVYLIENGADPAFSNKSTTTALHNATSEGNIDIILLLLSKGADVNASSSIGMPLHLAASIGKQDVIRVLLDHGANPNPFVTHVSSPLVLSMSQRSLQCTKLLIQAGADPNVISCGATPLCHAAKKGNMELFKCLLKAGADPNITDDTGLKPIEVAALSRNRREVGILLPVTSPIPTCPDWSINGIMTHVRSEEAIQQKNLRIKEKHVKAKSEGEDALQRKNYMEAHFYFSEAIELDPSDATVFSNRSNCYACTGNGYSALSDAKACIILRPDWPEAYYRAGTALSLLKKFNTAADTFLMGLKLDPRNKELQDAFQEAVEAKMNSIHI